MCSNVYSDDIEVSILIRTKNEEKFIGQTLNAIFSQPFKKFEVIVVDSGSTDKTLEIASKYPVEIYKINKEDFTFGYSLNYGFQRAKGKYVVSLSAHALPHSKDWINKAISNFSSAEVAAVMTRTLPWPDCNPFDRRGLLKKFDLPKTDIAQGPYFMFSNANSIIRRDAWKKVQFNDELTGSEDLDWQLKAAQLNYKIIYEPEAAVYHSHNETLKQIYVRSYREEYAIKKLNVRDYSIWRSIFDFTAGSIYDMLYVLYKKDNLKWLFFAFPRRFVMNLGRYRANLDAG